MGPLSIAVILAEKVKPTIIPSFITRACWWDGVRYMYMFRKFLYKIQAIYEPEISLSRYFRVGHRKVKGCGLVEGKECVGEAYLSPLKSMIGTGMDRKSPNILTLFI